MRPLSTVLSRLRRDTRKDGRLEPDGWARRNQLAEALDTISDGFALLDREDRFVLINANFRTMYSSVADALVPGARYRDFVERLAMTGEVPEAAGRIEAFVQERIDALHDLGRHLEYRTLRGRWIRLANFHTADGGTVCVRTDITELRSREQALQESEERFRRLSEITHEAVLILENGIILDFNSALVSLTGYAPEDLKGKSTLELLAPEFRDFAAERIATRDERPYEAIGLRADGSRLPVELNFRHVTHDGEVLRVVSVRDLRERRQAEQAIRDNEARMRAIVEAALDAIVTIDASGAILEFNSAAERIFGYRREEVLGKPVGDTIVPPAQREAHRTGMARYLATNAPRLIGQRNELDALRADGSTFPAELTMTELKLGERQLFTAFIRDLTEARRLEQEMGQQRERLHQSEKLGALGSLLAGVAHELNNPLSVVVAQATLLEETATDEKIAARGVRIRNAAERCAKIVRTFLAMARQRPQQRKLVRIGETVADALGLLSYGLRTSSISVSCDLPEDLPEIWADGDQVNQVLTNLIVNAQQAMADIPGERRLVIAARHEPDAALVRIEVRDSGIGVAPTIRPRIFDPFFTTKPTGIGTGVGLSVCHGIVTSHGGAITVDDAPEGGARFVVELPVGAPDAAPAPAAEPASPAAAADRRVLVVDDEAEIASTLAEILVLDGLAVDVAESGEAALHRIASRSYDAILSDLRMPGLDGPALYGRLDRERPDLARRMIIVTGDTLNPAAQTFLARSGLPCLEKPFDPADVRRVVGEVLASRDHQCEPGTNM
ncbi:MAG: PAS domain S-box protein [Alphaproteobacteria bacterium]